MFLIFEWLIRRHAGFRFLHDDQPRGRIAILGDAEVVDERAGAIEAPLIRTTPRRIRRKGWNARVGEVGHRPGAPRKLFVAPAGFGSRDATGRAVAHRGR